FRMHGRKFFSPGLANVLIGPTNRVEGRIGQILEGWQFDEGRLTGHSKDVWLVVVLKTAVVQIVELGQQWQCRYRQRAGCRPPAQNRPSGDLRQLVSRCAKSLLEQHLIGYVLDVGWAEVSDLVISRKHGFNEVGMAFGVIGVDEERRFN